MKKSKEQITRELEVSEYNIKVDPNPILDNCATYEGPPFMSIQQPQDKNELRLQKVVVCTDDSSHWYIIPSDTYEEFDRLMNLYYANDEDQDVINEFEEKFGQYRTGGDINNKQLYAFI